MPVPVILGQLTLGLVNGSFYALLSLGLAVIFGLMGVVNFAHGAFYTLGAFAALLGLQYLGINYWLALLLAPLAVGLIGVVVERLLLRHLYGLDPLYGLLLTFGLALIVEGSLHQVFGAIHRQEHEMQIERTRLGATLRAATENAPLLQAFGVNVPLLVAARKVAPSRVRSITNQVLKHTTIEARITQARYTGRNMKCRSSAPASEGGTG